MRRNHHMYTSTPARDLHAFTMRAGAGRFGCHNRQRAQLYAMADYYAWSARKRFKDDGALRLLHSAEATQGRKDEIARRITREADAAAARVCYRAARELRNPLP